MTPSKSSLDRLPKLVSKRWEADREAHEAALRNGLVIPAETVTVAISLDGVLAPIDGSNRPVAVRNAAAAEGWQSYGPAGYREVGCATLSFCDDEGELLGAIRIARAPEPGKCTLKASLAAECAPRCASALRKRDGLCGAPPAWAADRLGDRRSRLQDVGGATAQAQRHAQGTWHTGDPYRARMGSK
jgi:hypothetical protein